MTTVGPDFTLICWSIAVIGLVVLALLGILRWSQHKPIEPLHRASLFVCVLTVVWVWPGVVAAAVLAIATASRGVVHRLTV